jgi:alpha-N-arabinofuranosidase
MHCYAPLFVNVNPGAMQWTTDLIGYDTTKAYGSPAYWAQQMFANHVGSDVVNFTVSGLPYKEWQQAPRRQGGGRGAPAADPSGRVPQTPQPVPLPEMFFSVTKDAGTGVIYANVVNRQGTPQAVNVKLSGVASVAATGRSITLSGASPNDTNSITEMHKVEPVEAEISGVSLDFTRTFPPNSITVLELRGK